MNLCKYGALQNNFDTVDSCSKFMLTNKQKLQSFGRNRCRISSCAVALGSAIESEVMSASESTGRVHHLYEFVLFCDGFQSSHVERLMSVIGMVIIICLGKEYRMKTQSFDFLRYI